MTPRIRRFAFDGVLCSGTAFAAGDVAPALR